MPNHISNLLKFYGSPERIAAVKAAIGTPEQPIDFSYLEPYPEPFRQMDADHPGYLCDDRAERLAVYKAKWGTESDGFNSGGYEWRNEHWDTKWNAYTTRIEDDEDIFYAVRFQTAWSWPEKFVRKILAEFSDLNITFLSACEGGWFAVYIEHDPGGESSVERIWNGRMMGREHNIVIAALNDALRTYKATPIKEDTPS